MPAACALPLIDLSFRYTGSLTFGNWTIDGSQVAASGRWDWSGATVNYDDNGVYLTSVTVVPEPGTLMLLASGCLGLLLVWRKRRWR
jgi:hypothetical protein